MREPKGREDRCEKESRERQWDPMCQWVNRSTGLVNAPNMNYFSQNTFFFILQLFLAPFFNFFPLSDLNIIYPKFREKSDFFGKISDFSTKNRRVFPIFFLPIFFCQNCFHAVRKSIFRR